MSKLTALYFKLDLKKTPVFVSPVCLFFMDALTGQPSTVIEYEDKLLVSGNKPGGGVHRYDDVEDCLMHTNF